MTWEALVVEELRRWKVQAAAGVRVDFDHAGRYDFEAAWQAALLRHPAPGRYTRGLRGEEQLTLGGSAGEKTLVEFFRDSCEDAWYGRRPKLAGLQAALEGGLRSDDGVEAAHRTSGGRGRLRMAA